MVGAVKSILNRTKPLRSPKAVGVSPAAQGVANQVQSSVGTPQPNIGTVTTPYGGVTRYEAYHPGIDIGAPMGTPINAFMGGKVIQETSGQKQGNKGFGNSVVLIDENGNRHRYSHLTQEYVKVGDYVPMGGRLGTIGNTGSTYSESGGTGSHLDYRVMDAWNKYINPNRFLKMTNKLAFK